jgi:hypothetical protein
VFLDVGEDGLGKVDPDTKVGRRCCESLGEGHVLEDGLAVATGKAGNVVVELGGGNSEECFRMGFLAFGGLMEMVVADIPLSTGRGLEELGPGSHERLSLTAFTGQSLGAEVCGLQAYPGCVEVAEVHRFGP